MTHSSLALISEITYPNRILMYVLEGCTLRAFQDFPPSRGAISMGPRTLVPLGSKTLPLIDEHDGSFCSITLRSGMTGFLEQTSGSKMDIEQLLGGAQTKTIGLGSVSLLGLLYENRAMLMKFKRPASQGGSGFQAPLPFGAGAPVLAGSPVLYVMAIPDKDVHHLDSMLRGEDDSYVMAGVRDTGATVNPKTGFRIGPGTEHVTPSLSNDFAFALVRQRAGEPPYVHLRADLGWTCWLKDEAAASWQTFAELQANGRATPYNRVFEVAIPNEASVMVLVDSWLFLLLYTAQPTSMEQLMSD